MNSSVVILVLATCALALGEPANRVKHARKGTEAPQEKQYYMEPWGTELSAFPEAQNELDFAPEPRDLVCIFGGNGGCSLLCRKIYRKSGGACDGNNNCVCSG